VFQTSTILFQASADFKVSRGYIPDVENIGTSQGLLPFSAIIHRRDRYDSNRFAIRPQVFSTSRQIYRPHELAGLFHPAGTHRVATYRVCHQIEPLPFPALPAPSLFPVLHVIPPGFIGAIHTPDRIRFYPFPTSTLVVGQMIPDCRTIPGYDLDSILDFGQP